MSFPLGIRKHAAFFQPSDCAGEIIVRIAASEANLLVNVSQPSLRPIHEAENGLALFHEVVEF